MTSDTRETTTPRKARPARRKADVTRSAILVAAAMVFAEKGYNDCNLREIAEKVGIKAGSFYYHFRSKDQILDEILDAGLTLITRSVSDAIAGVAPDAPVCEKIAAAIRAHISAFLGGDRDQAALMRVYEHLPPAMKRRSRAQRRTYAQIWYDLFEAGVRAGELRADLDLKLMVPFILAGLSRVIEWYNPRHMRIEDICALAVALLLDGGARAPAKPARKRAVAAPQRNETIRTSRKDPSRA